MKNYLIKHAVRRIEKFLKLAQSTTRVFDVFHQRLSDIFAEYSGDKEVGKFAITGNVQKILLSLKDIKEINPNEPEYKKVIYSLHLLISEVTAEVNDAVDNPDIDEELADLGETDFYSDFEEVLLDIQQTLEDDFGVDTNSQDYKEADSEMLDSFFQSDISEDKSDKSKKGLTDGQPTQKETRGLQKRVEDQIRTTAVDLQPYRKNEKMNRVCDEILKLLNNEKLPLVEQADTEKKALSELGIPHFIKKDILDPNVLKKEYLPDGRVKKKKLWINIVNPEWKAAGGKTIMEIEKINGKIVHLRATLDRLDAEYNISKGIVPGIERVVPQHQALYKKLIDLRNILYIKQNMMSHSSSNGTVTKSLDYIIERLLDSKNNPFDPEKDTNASQLRNIQDYIDNIRAMLSNNHSQLVYCGGQNTLPPQIRVFH